MKLKFISDFAQIECDQQQWDSVAGSFPFFRWSWMANWFRHLGTNLRLAVLVACDENDDWIGIAPWCIDSTNPFATKLRFLGSGQACSDYLNLICHDQDFQRFSTLATDWLIENIGDPQTLGRIDVIELEGIAANEQTDFLGELYSANGMKTHTTDLEGGWVVDLPPSWEELNATFSKSMRRKTKKAVQRVASSETEILSTQNMAFDELWPIFTQLHQQRRRMLGQSGCFASRDFENFLKDATSELVTKSKAELLVIQFEGTPLATMMMLNDDETAYNYQAGMDVERLHLEPGYQICYLAIKNSIDRGFQKFDFLRGDEPYKSRWNTTRVPIMRKRFIPRNAVANLKHNIWLTGRSLKHYVKSTTAGNSPPQ